MYLPRIKFSSLKIECLQSAAFFEGSGMEPRLRRKLIARLALVPNLV